MQRITRQNAAGSGGTYIKRVVLAHLVLELLANPFTDLGATFFVEPATSLDFFYHPLPLALFGEHPAEPSIVRASPEGEIEQEKDSTDSAWKSKEQDQLET